MKNPNEENVSDEEEEENYEESDTVYVEDILRLFHSGDIQGLNNLLFENAEESEYEEEEEEELNEEDEQNSQISELSSIDSINSLSSVELDDYFESLRLRNMEKIFFE
jgi:hypothetical protein